MPEVVHRIIITDNTIRWIELFFLDCSARNLSPGTIKFYKTKLQLLWHYLDSQAVSSIEQLTPEILRAYLVYLASTGHNPGGIHAAYRALRSWLLWYEAEMEPLDWINPVRKVKAPRYKPPPMQPVTSETITRLLAVCGNDFTGKRDKAIILTLFDTGCRAAELLALQLSDIDFAAGIIHIRHGKGDKARIVCAGSNTRRAMRQYIYQRHDICPAYLVTDKGYPLTYSGLRQIIRRRANSALVQVPQLHDFRRAFALNYLRNGGDIYSLQSLMGHADLQILRRYIAQTETDIALAHRKYSPVDNM